MNKFENIIKKVAILCAIEVEVLSFAVISGIRNGFKLWNWLVIIIGVLTYFVFTIIVVAKENTGRKKVNEDQLIVSNSDRTQAQLILGSIDKYLKDNQKIANDLKLYWPFYKAMLKRISIGKKYNGDDYGILDPLRTWQQENYEDAFLKNIYDVLVNNVV